MEREQRDVCERCRYSEQGTYTLCCHRRAPVYDVARFTHDGSPFSCWPAVLPTDWCGEFEPKPPELRFRHDKP